MSSQGPSPSWNLRRVGYIAFVSISVGCGFAAYRYGGALIDNNKDAMDVIVTLFSILAGFIIAIMSLLGEGALRPGGWRRAGADAELVRRRLDRQQHLFWLYLFTLTLVLAGRLVTKSAPLASVELQRIAFGVAVTALILSYALPVALRGAQISRMAGAVEDQRKKSSILDQH